MLWNAQSQTAIHVKNKYQFLWFQFSPMLLYMYFTFVIQLSPLPFLCQPNCTHALAHLHTQKRTQVINRLNFWVIHSKAPMDRTNRIRLSGGGDWGMFRIADHQCAMHVGCFVAVWIISQLSLPLTQRLWSRSIETLLWYISQGWARSRPRFGPMGLPSNCYWYHTLYLHAMWLCNDLKQNKLIDWLIDWTCL